MEKIKALIIDDEHLARQVIKSYLDTDEDIQVIGECKDGFEGYKKINERQPDLIFLDIMMPKLTGFEMLELVEDPPVVVFSTAYDEYAIKAFEQNAVDYLLKPYTEDRFSEAVQKAKEKIQTKSSVEPALQKVMEQHQKKEVLNRIVVRNGAKIHIIGLDQIQYLEAQDDYVKIYSSEGNFLKQQTMKYYESQLPPNDFLRIHRSYIVRLKEITSVEPMGKDTHVAKLHDGTELSVSRSGYGRLKEVLGF